MDSATTPLPKSDSFNADSPSPTGLGVSGEPGPMLSQLYGFLASITAVVAAGIYVIWAYVPDYWLRYIGIDYYPSRYWELGVPTYVTVMIVVAIVLYTGLNFLATPPPTSMKLIFEEYSEDILTGIPITDDGEPVLEPLSDMGIDHVDQLLNNLNS
ncbi:phosphatidylinositol N-acetylglucosaminyltransferase subunit P-like [Salvia miltiorrhiza]|uniref:phosphatidylinositol N-acetylglucosaminyltransferase subunit P-like n=1 Tax=Salvia miltiorrhiza TaxID=226208 RepID=UPI0025AC445D|nr:phosphatidylinositol N-acetylglucosaminyltransferase subunit P-like [Salvia miltiorrhiza]